MGSPWVGKRGSREHVRRLLLSSRWSGRCTRVDRIEISLGIKESRPTERGKALGMRAVNKRDLWFWLDNSCFLMWLQQNSAS